MDKSKVVLILFIIIFYLMWNKSNKKKIQVFEYDPPFSEYYPKNTKNTDKLSILLNDISSSDKVLLTDITDRWSVTKDTIDEEIKEPILPILHTITEAISYATGNNYVLNEIENMYIMKDNYNNFRCILVCFVFNATNSYTVKLVTDFVSANHEVFINFIDIDETSNDNILNNYDIKWKSQGILSNANMFQDNISEILDTYYHNNHEVIHLNYRNNHNIDTSATFTLNQFKRSYYPASMPAKKDSPLFCRKNKNTWNNQSVMLPNNENCIHNNNSYELYPNTPINGPNIINRMPDNNIFEDLFKPDRTILPQRTT